MLHRMIFPLDDPQQAHLMRRFLMGIAASAMVLGLLFLSSLFGVLAFAAFAVAASITGLLLVLFFAVFRLGINKRFNDPSLTLVQIVASMLVILYALYESPAGHGVLSLIFMVSFLFGVLRLSTPQLLGLAAFVSLAYAAIIALQSYPFADRARLNQDVLHWIVLTAVLVFFSIMGGYISSLRKKLSETHTSLEAAMRRIERLAGQDELTGVLNRRSLAGILGRQKARADRYGLAFSILVIDLDLFKRINDTLGHPAGDAVLVRFATAASASLRQSDTFGRYGGEEFLAVLDLTNIDGACIVGERMCAMARALQVDETDTALRVTVSVGIAQYRAREEWAAMIERADQALYRAKAGGRDRIERETEN
jgi:diguanylate cyclase (GGDEF)-like protein